MRPDAVAHETPPSFEGVMLPLDCVEATPIMLSFGPDCSHRCKLREVALTFVHVISETGHHARVVFRAFSLLGSVTHAYVCAYCMCVFVPCLARSDVARACCIFMFHVQFAFVMWFLPPRGAL